jgi:hypothetical protein
LRDASRKNEGSSHPKRARRLDSAEAVVTVRRGGEQVDSLTYKIIEGHPDDVLPRLRRSVGQLARNVGEFKIGRTSSPEVRASHHGYAHLDEMLVIYRTLHADHVNIVERDLIDYFSSHSDITNFRRGGGGLLGRAPHYVYLVRSKTLVDNVFSIFD